jgi:hypothetical protein
MVELEARVSHVQLRPGVPREIPEAEASVTCIGWLRRHSQRRYDGCDQHDRAHRLAP